MREFFNKYIVFQQTHLYHIEHSDTQANSIGQSEMFCFIDKSRFVAPHKYSIVHRQMKYICE